MTTHTTPKRQTLQSMPGGNLTLAKRSRKSRGFIEYQTPDTPAAKTPVSGKQKTNATSRQMSCGECRRLKLKCDRVFPCKACVRRGCQGICPSGSLVSGKGTRYILASTEQLHEKISRMGDRIQELETALQTLYEEHCKCPSGLYGLATNAGNQLVPVTHPLLHGEKLLVKNQLELYGEDQGAYLEKLAESSLPNREQVDSMPGDRRTGAEAISSGENSERGTNGSPPPIPMATTGTANSSGTQPLVPLHPSSPSLIISKLNSSFLTVWTKIAQGESGDTGVDCIQLGDPILERARMEILEMVPAREEADRLCNVAREAGFFVLNYILTDLEFRDIIHNVYDKPHANVSMIKAGLLFILLCIGLRVDCIGPKSSVDTDTTTDRRTEAFCDLSCAAMTLQAVEAGPKVLGESGLNILKHCCLLMQYIPLLSFCKQDRHQTRDIMALVVSLTRIAELQSESMHSNYSKEDQNGHRVLLYEILSVVGDLSLAIDQPTPFSSVEICRPPSCSRDIPTQIEASYYKCKHVFYVDCFKPLLDMHLSPPSNILYTDILELDCKIRTYPFPVEVLHNFDDTKLDDIPGITPSPFRLKLLRFLTAYRSNSLLLHLHRKYLQQCLGAKNSVLAHPYLASLIATSRSAWLLIRICDNLHQEHPELVGRLTLVWYNVFCAASALFISVERIPYCPLSPYSLRELIRAAELFSRAADLHSPMAEQTALIVRQFAVKASESLRRWKENLASEVVDDQLLRDRKDNCTSRLNAMISRTKRVNASPVTPLSTTYSTECTNEPVTDGLEVWNIVHPEIGELLTQLPDGVIDEKTSDELLWETVHSPLHDQGDRNSDSSNLRTPLTDFFDALDHQLWQRPAVASTGGDTEMPSPEPAPDAAAALRDMFPNDLDLDWGALTDALIAAPAELMSADPGSDWTGQWEWQSPAPTSDVHNPGASRSGIMDSVSALARTPRPF